ncbi:ABC transporter ATP-binding protein [Thiolinea disciformis]|uniref:ABC transporter ATP-binding protein n=1 Tax=Thiolinea disciformis TaxID=125614 RepID=UPI0003603413|nr:ABC transporter ATP-binding protein [Thiolinea disciformis]
MSLLQVALGDKTFANGVQTLCDVHFSVESGEFVALVGPSGTGKTTLLNLIAGLETDFQGHIQAPREALSYMFQEPRLMPWLSVENNIRLVLDAPPLQADNERFARMDKLLQQLSLSVFRAAFPKQLSGGLKRRVALVRAFVTQPQLLLMDEPFQSLDEPTAQDLRQLLIQLWQNTRPTVLFVTHSLNEALQLADRILFFSARPAQVILDYRVPLARPRSPITSDLQSVQNQLLQHYPQLLSGSLAKE